MKKNVSIKDVARETGVHVSTVSRALSPNARASLSAEVVSKIREKAEAMGYRPNRVASGLRTNRTMSVGVIIPDITNALFPPIVRGVESVLEPAGYASILVNTDSDPEREARFLEVLLERGVDGIIDAAVSHIDSKTKNVAQRTPVVTANRLVVGSGIPSVVNDDSGGIRQMVRHLVAAGHRHIGHVGGPDSISTGVSRREAFVSELAAAGLPLAPGAVVASLRYTEDEGQSCAQRILESHSEITALLCANDRLAIGALDALDAMNLRCPQDVSVTGFNDIPFLDRISPALTTVRILQFDVGRIAAELLLKKMTSPDAAIPETTIMPVEVVSRASVAAPGRSETIRKRKSK